MAFHTYLSYDDLDHVFKEETPECDNCGQELFAHETCVFIPKSKEMYCTECYSRLNDIKIIDAGDINRHWN